MTLNSILHHYDQLCLSEVTFLHNITLQDGHDLCRGSLNISETTLVTWWQEKCQESSLFNLLLFADSFIQSLDTRKCKGPGNGPFGHPEIR